MANFEYRYLTFTKPYVGADDITRSLNNHRERGCRVIKSNLSTAIYDWRQEETHSFLLKCRNKKNM